MQPASKLLWPVLLFCICSFLEDRRRLNVSLTRARYALYIVGHMQTLRKVCAVCDLRDKNWIMYLLVKYEYI